MEQIEIERQVLSTAMKDQQCAAITASILSPEHFDTEMHRFIWDAILEVVEEGAAPNSFNITERLRRHRRLTAAGGAAYVSELEDYSPDYANPEYYAKIMIEYYQMRRLKHVGSQAQHYEDPAALIEYMQNQMDNILSEGHADTADGPSVVAALLSDAESQEEREPGVPTGLEGIDGILSGLQRGQLIIIAARPSVGKSALATNIIRHNLDKKVAIFSLEMSKKQVMGRIIGAEERINTTNFKSGRFDLSGVPNDIERIRDFQLKHADMNLFIDDRGSLNVPTMKALLTNIKLKHGLDLVIVDYLQLMNGPGNSRNEEVGSISRSLKGLAKDLDVPVIALSQLSRDRDKQDFKEEYSLQELRDSGSIEQDADVVIFIVRKIEAREGVFQIAKHRDGPTGRSPFRYTPEYCLFEDMSIDEWLERE